MCVFFNFWSLDDILLIAIYLKHIFLVVMSYLMVIEPFGALTG